MDTISQENNESFSWLPLLALIVGVIAAVLGGVALKKLGDINKTLADQNALTARIDSLETELRKTSTSADAATQRINKVAADTNTAFKQFSDAFGGLRTEFETIKESAVKPAPVVTSAPGGSSGPAVAGPDEYVVKSGDTGIKIARANNVSWGDLQAVNPSVNWNRLGVGQTIKLPKK
ncbi:LysM peptidoglycan-binding domain-containing protein [Synoicihabitans lomoniglobus]|uniref:LysM domain-containing protein n=1 Tax=Synoicihabitans lomoniglobus TaxID=2909285 RepID=A0AAF0CMB7_9BACT|nr:LysM peptidoglycan-binding domain-containing protein [Opitutaceae bacterium LMO-M01]WED63888.1 LysM domain-containing protein [Opitutaceae bacterium LMO-M01]